VVEALGRQLQRHDFLAKRMADRADRRFVGALPVSCPEELAVAVPDAIAGALLQDARREVDDLVDQAALLQLHERRAEHRLLALALGMAETGQHHLAVQHHRSVRREHQVGQAADGLNGFHVRARGLQGGLELGRGGLGVG